jgi:formylglycine-generating enzyme required for sulfatase activity
MRRYMRILGLLALVCISGSRAEVNFTWVNVGDEGNPPNGSYGSVDHVYSIAVTEVTQGQYAEFLNAVAAVGDPNVLCSANMRRADLRGGIQRTGAGTSGDPYVYTPFADMADKPVNYVSCLSAMRFVNWLHNGQPSGGQEAGTTEAGVYAIVDGLTETRAVDARYFLPTEHEWYKAAYYDPGKGGTGGYYKYATRSDTLPTEATATETGDVSNPGSNVANYNYGADWGTGSYSFDGNMTTVGSAESVNYYGAFDQTGNVAEMLETLYDAANHVVRGGNYLNPGTVISSSTRAACTPSYTHAATGFRVAGPPWVAPAKGTVISIR